MDYLWSPWRYRYVSSGVSEPGCLFCRIAASPDDAANYVVHRAARNFVVLNRFPYTSGHLMVAPYAHVATLSDCDPRDLEEMIALTRRAESALGEGYSPDGFNIGMNVGRSAGAGVAGHIHMHVLPRWHGDASFVTTVGETRVLPEELETSYAKLKALFSL
jgi:ATP adenylyltransferase